MAAGFLATACRSPPRSGESRQDARYAGRDSRTLAMTTRPLFQARSGGHARPCLGRCAMTASRERRSNMPCQGGTSCGSTTCDSHGIEKTPGPPVIDSCSRRQRQMGGRALCTRRPTRRHGTIDKDMLNQIPTGPWPRPKLLKYEQFARPRRRHEGLLQPYRVMRRKNSVRC